MLFAADGFTTVGALLGAVATLIAAYAALQSRKTEQRSATKDETQQALDAQSNLLNRYEKRIGGLEASLENALGKLADSEVHRKDCEVRVDALENKLHIAEAKIAELGG